MNIHLICRTIINICKSVVFITLATIPIISNASMYTYTVTNAFSDTWEANFDAQDLGGYYSSLTNVSLKFNGVDVGPIYALSLDSSFNWVHGGSVISNDPLRNNFLFINSDIANGNYNYDTFLYNPTKAFNQNYGSQYYNDITIANRRINGNLTNSYERWIYNDPFTNNVTGAYNASFTYNNGVLFEDYNTNLQPGTITTQSVPEPLTVTLLGIGMIGMRLARRHQAS